METSGGFSYEARVLLMSEHGPTHVDALYEMDPKGKTIDRMSIEWFYGPGNCLDLSHVPGRTFITVHDLKTAVKKVSRGIMKRDIVLIWTGIMRETMGHLGGSPITLV